MCSNINSFAPHNTCELAVQAGTANTAWACPAYTLAYHAVLPSVRTKQSTSPGNPARTPLGAPHLRLQDAPRVGGGRQQQAGRGPKPLLQLVRLVAQRLMYRSCCSLCCYRCPRRLDAARAASACGTAGPICSSAACRAAAAASVRQQQGERVHIGAEGQAVPEPRL